MAQITFGSTEADQIAKEARKVELSLEYLENLPDPTESEMWLMSAIEELGGAQEELRYAETILAQSQEEVWTQEKNVLEERKNNEQK